MNEVEQFSIDTNSLQALANDILQEAKRAGADQAAVNISKNKGFSVSAREGDVETVEYNQDKLVEISVLFGKRSGSSSITDLRPESVRAGVEAACHIAKFTDHDPDSGLAEKEELALQYPQLNLSYPWDISVEKAIELAIECERMARSYDKRIMSAEEVRVATVGALHLYANTNGFMGFYPYTRHEVSCVLIAKDGEDMQRDYSYTIGVDPTQLDSIAHVAEMAAQRAVQRLGAKQIRTTKAPVIYAAEEARGLLGHFTGAIAGGSIYRKSSFLVDHLDEKIFPDFMHIQEQPHMERAMGSAPFDEDGVATRANVFIEDGILRTYALGVYAARKLKMQTTGNAGGIHNLVVKTGNKTLAELIKTMDKGLLVTEMMGNGVNLLTGDYSRGVGGYWIENGEIQYPVHEITVAGKLQDMYARIKEIGGDIDKRGNIHTGSILIEEMMIAGS